MTEFQIPARYGPLSGLIASFTREVRAAVIHAPGDQIAWNAQLLFVDSVRFNARARLSAAGEPTYVFNCGVALALFDACMLLASSPDFCPELKFESEVIHRGSFSLPERFCDYSYAIGPDNIRVWPFSHEFDERTAMYCPRYRLGRQLFEMAIKALCLHEQSHFLQGHLHYMNDFSPGATWDEAFAAAPPDGITPLESRVLEMMADIWAFKIFFNITSRQILANRKGEGTGLQMWISDAATSSAEFAFYWILGACIFFGILDRCDALQNKPLTERSHPSATVRLIATLNYMMHSFREHIFPLVDESQWVRRVIEACREMFKVLECPSFSAAAVESVLLQQPISVADARLPVREYLELHSSIERVLPNLQKYTNVILPR